MSKAYEDILYVSSVQSVLLYLESGTAMCSSISQIIMIANNYKKKKVSIFEGYQDYQEGLRNKQYSTLL